MICMKKYYKDYEPDSKVLDNGKVVKRVVYKGEYYRYEGSFENFKKQFNRLLAMTVIYTLLFVAAAFVNSPGSRNFLVYFSYFGSFLPMAYLWTALFGRITLLYNSRNSTACEQYDKLEFARYERTYCRIKRCTVAMIVLLAIAAISSLVLIFMHIGKAGFWQEVVFFAGAILLIIVANMIRKENLRVSCTKIANKSAIETNE